MKWIGLPLVALVGCGVTTTTSERSDAPLPRLVEVSSSTSSSPPPTTTSVPEVAEFDGDYFDFTIASETVDVGAFDVQAAVIDGGRIVHQFVASSGGSRHPVTTDSRFRVASISKLFLAAAVMHLVEQGRLDLDDRVLDRLALELGMDLADGRMKDITVRQLLAHTSGFNSFADLFFESPSLTTDEVIEKAFGTTLDADPGREFLYSNLNYVLLGRLVGTSLSTTWQEAVRRLVFEPLGIKNVEVGRTQSSFDSDAFHRSKPDRNYMELLEAAGSWVASATDVAVIVDAVALGVSFESNETTLSMLIPSSSGPRDENWTYGLGVRLFPEGVWGHSGTLESAHAMVVHRPDGKVVAVLVNGEVPRDTDTLLDTISRALSPPPPSTSLEATADPGSG